MAGLGTSLTIVLVAFGVLIVYSSLGILWAVLRMHLRMLLGWLWRIHLRRGKFR